MTYVSEVQGFEFNNKHSSDFDNLIIESVERPLRAEQRFSEEPIPNRDSSHKFEDGYSDILVTVRCKLQELDINVRRNILKEISSWISVEGDLVFDDELDKSYHGKVYKLIENKDDYAECSFTLLFLCDPAQYSTYDNSNIPYFKNLEISNDLVEGLKTSFSSITGYKEVKVSNLGTKDAEPIIEIEGTADSISISNSTDISTILNITEKTYIDCKNLLCYTIDGLGNKINKLKDHSGGFPHIVPGLNTFVIDGTNLNVSVFLNFKNTYL